MTRTCSDLFIDAAGGLILELSETRGSAAELARTRAAAQAEGPPAQPLPGFSAGFISGQQLAFLAHGHLVTLNAGKTTNGETELTATQLVRLARVVARR